MYDLYVDAAEYEDGFRTQSRSLTVPSEVAFLLIWCLLVSLLTSLHRAVEMVKSISRSLKR